MSPSTEEVAFDTPETVTDTDPPQARLDLPPRTLEFRIMVGSGTSATCTHASICVTAQQVLASTSTTPLAIQTQVFETPNPNDAC
jgi:hypothetical protein